MNGNTAKFLQAYIEYRNNIVGNLDDDCGQMMNAPEFEYEARAHRGDSLDIKLSSLADA